MAETYWPFDAGSGAASAEDRWMAMAPLWSADGVTAAAGLAVTTLSGRNLSVAIGDAWCHGAFYRNDSAKTLAVTANSSGNPRIDRVILRRDLSANTVTAQMLTGTPAASPTVPALTQIATGVWDTPICQYRAETGFVNTDPLKITDERWLVKSAQAAPFGLVGFSRVITGTQATTAGAEVIWAAANLSVLLFAGRKYRLTVLAQVDAGASTGIKFNLNVRNSLTSSAPNTSSTPISQITNQTGNTVVTTISWTDVYVATVSGTQVLGLSVVRTAGASELNLSASAISPALLMVEDLGT